MKKKERKKKLMQSKNLKKEEEGKMVFRLFSALNNIAPY